MNRRKACFLSGAFLFGIAAAQFHQAALWALLALYCLAWTRSIRKEEDARAAYKTFWIAAMFLAVCGGVYDSRRAAEFRDLYEGRLKDGEQCLLQGEIYKRETDGDTRLYYLKNCRTRLRQQNYECNHVLLYLNAESYSIGEILLINGTVQTFALPSNEGNYNERAYYQSLGIDFKVKGKRVISVSGKKSVLREAFYSLREKLKESYQNSMPNKDAGVLYAMVLGDKSQMDLERKGKFQNAGVSHFYSISGLHVSMVGMAAYHMAFQCGGGFFISGALAAAWILAYGELAGFGISASRAIGMFLFLTYAKCRGKSYDRATALALAAAVLAGRNPWILQNAGYLLSHSAVLGVLLAERLFQCGGGAGEKGEKSRMRALAEKIWQALMTSVCIQIVTIPVMGIFFYEISTYAVLLNLIVLPLMGALLGLGILGGALGCFLPFAGKAVLYPCHLILLLFERACGFALKLPCASFITGKPDVWELLLWYGLAVVFLTVKKRWPKLPVSALALPLCLLLLWAPDQAFEVDFLDVGQGDGIYISAGGADMFIDGGSSNVKGVGTRRILPFLKCRGARSVDYWFVSHCDADHVSGIREIIEAGYPIRNLVVSKYMPEDTAWENLKGLAAEARIPVLAMGKGDALRGDGFCMTCFSFAGQGAAGDRNENSLALFFASEVFSGFFAGDIGEAQERALAEEWKLPKADLYKASHHGSNNSNSREILKSLRPEVTVISCGEGNSYGHPGAEALMRMREAGCRIYETRRLGQIKIKGDALEAEGFSVLK